MTSSIRKVLLRGVGVAAATSARLTGPVLAGTPAGASAAPQEQAGATAELILNAETAQAAPQVAQTYVAPVEAEVVEVESVNGWYLTVGAGAAWPSDVNVRTRNFDPNFNGDVSFNGGFSVDGGLGYDFGALRAELTYGYTRSNVGDVQFNNVDFSSSGIINKNDVMASLYWDILPGRWTPYIGGGIGYTNLSTPSFRVDGNRTSSANQGLFGWQAKVGLSYALAYNWDIYAEGTYAGAEGFSSNNVRWDAYNDFGAKLGFRYRFASPEVVVVEAPAPAPAPEPMPEPAPMPMPEPEPAPIRGLW
jgi:opacity protein-like surface antigen